MTSNTKTSIFLCSTVSYIALLFVLYFSWLSGPFSIFILLAKLSVYILSIYLLIRLLYSIRKRHGVILQFCAFMITVVLIILSAILFPFFAPPHPDSIKTACENNLKQYYISLKQYADDNDGYFPVKGLDELVLQGYLPDQFYCWAQYDFSPWKFTRTQPDGIYQYYGGHTIHEAPPAVIMEDENHNEYKLRLYSDGRIEADEKQAMTSDKKTNSMQQNP